MKNKGIWEIHHARLNVIKYGSPVLSWSRFPELLIHCKWCDFSYEDLLPIQIYILATYSMSEWILNMVRSWLQWSISLSVAFVIFLLVKGINKLAELGIRKDRTKGGGTGKACHRSVLIVSEMPADAVRNTVAVPLIWRNRFPESKCPAASNGASNLKPPWTAGYLTAAVILPWTHGVPVYCCPRE